MANFYIAPGRINIIGEHTDYNDGYILPAAIDKYIQVSFEKKDEGLTEVVSGEKRGEFDSNNPQKTNSWLDYVQGVFKVLKEKEGVEFPQFKIEVKSNLPEGAGLSSSAALEVSIITALDDLLDLNLSEKKKFLYCQEAENKFVGMNCGVMDQMASVLGKKDNAIFVDTETLEYEYIPLKMENFSLIVLNSKIHHELVAGDYNKRREESGNALKELNKKNYKDLSITDLILNRRKIDQILYKRAMHVVSENGRVLESIGTLKNSNWENLGRFLLQSHESLSYDYEVSCEEIDYLIEEIRKQNRVTGARMIGGGFGGSILLVVENEYIDEVMKELNEKYKEKYDIEFDYYIVNPSEGARKIDKPVL